MSVQSEITRLANAKTALATAIEGKGVTVPDGTLLDGMAALIEAIEAGGGGGGYNFGDTAFEVVSGSFTTNEKIICNEMFPSASPLYLPFEDMTSNVKKGRGRWFVLWDCVPDSTNNGVASEIYNSTETNQIIAAFHFYVYANNGDREEGIYMYRSSSGYSEGGGYWFGNATSIVTNDPKRFFGAGRTYQWVSWTTRAVYDT